MLYGKPHTVHKEKWFTFYRVQFSDKYIDLCKCNMLDNPNDDEKCKVKISNGTSHFGRLEGEDTWYHLTNYAFLRFTELTQSADKVFHKVTKEMPETTDDLRAIKKELKQIHTDLN